MNQVWWLLFAIASAVLLPLLGWTLWHRRARELREEAAARAIRNSTPWRPDQNIAYARYTSQMPKQPMPGPRTRARADDAAYASVPQQRRDLEDDYVPISFPIASDMPGIIAGGGSFGGAGASGSWDSDSSSSSSDSSSSSSSSDSSSSSSSDSSSSSSSSGSDS